MKTVALIQFLVLIFFCNEVAALKSILTSINPVKVVEQNSARFQNPDQKLLNLASFIKNNLQATNGTVDCNSSLKRIYGDAVGGQIYALKYFDSWGHLESGILQGNLQWYGRYKECFQATNTSLNLGFSPKYSLIRFKEKNETKLIIGACIPNTCSILEFNARVQQLVPEASVLDMPLSFPGWQTKDIMMMFLLSTLFIFVVASTLLDVKIRKSRRESGVYSELYATSTQYTNSTSDLTKLCLCFSIIRNTENLLDTSKAPEQVSCLYGLRFFSMLWVFFTHTNIFAIHFIDNPVDLFQYSIDHWTYQIVINSSFCVDTFFFISGLLVCYNGLKQMENNGGKLHPFQMYFLRYMRLTPTYAFCIFFSITIWNKIGEGPMFMFLGNYLQKSCQQFWWTNLLYINTLYPPKLDNECYAWGWYLANDMIFYILSPIFIFALYKKPFLGKFITGFVIFVSILLTGIFSILTSQQPETIYLGQVAKSTLSTISEVEGEDSSPLNKPDQYSLYISDLYTKPYIRIGAYLIGLLTGYFLHKNRYNKIYISKTFAGLGWICSSFLSCLLIFGLYSKFRVGQQLPVPIASLYNSICRPLWCLSLTWLTVACVNSHGYFVNTILSSKLIIPLSRLTYSCYLLHPLVIWLNYSSSETTMHITIFYLIISFIGQLFIIHLLAYLVSMLVEFPFFSIAKFFLRKLNK